MSDQLAALVKCVQRVVEAYNRLPDKVAEAVDRRVMEQHQPFDVGNGEVWCTAFAHRRVQPWPCADWSDAAERRRVRRLDTD